MQLPQPSVSNDNQTMNFAILGNGLNTDSRYGDLNRVAKMILAELLHPLPISEDGKRHETAVGQLGEANFVIFFDPSQTLRTFVDVTTIGADKKEPTLRAMSSRRLTSNPGPHM